MRYRVKPRGPMRDNSKSISVRMTETQFQKLAQYMTRNNTACWAAEGRVSALMAALASQRTGREQRQHWQRVGKLF